MVENVNRCGRVFPAAATIYLLGAMRLEQLGPSIQCFYGKWDTAGSACNAQVAFFRNLSSGCVLGQ